MAASYSEYQFEQGASFSLTLTELKMWSIQKQWSISYKNYLFNGFTHKETKISSWYNTWTSSLLSQFDIQFILHSFPDIQLQQNCKNDQIQNQR
jgi:lysozyme family protein